ncbi:MAG: glycosyltransferase family 25 protein [Candidatus Paceibacterota bacterium]
MFTTFVINLDKDKDRMDHMRHELTKLSIDYRRQAGVSGREYTPSKDEYDEEQAIKKGGHALIPGEVGCALSHARVIETIVKERISYALVLEDDIAFPSNFKTIIEKEIGKNKNQDWEYLLFDYVVVGIPFIKQWVKGVFENVKKLWQDKPIKSIAFSLYAIFKAFYIIPLSLFEGMRNKYKKLSPGPVRFFRPVYFAGAYLVSLGGAEKLYSLTRPIIYTADHLPNRARILKGLKFRGYAPQSVRQLKQEFGSSILDLEGGKL